VRWWRVCLALELLACAKVEGNSGIRGRYSQNNVWYFIADYGTGMRLGARLFGPDAPEAQTARPSVFSSQSHEVREAQHVQPVPTKIARYFDTLETQLQGKHGCRTTHSKWYYDYRPNEHSKTLVFRRDTARVLDAAYAYPIDLQELSLETNSPIITHCGEFSEICSRGVGGVHISTVMISSAKNTVPSNGKIYKQRRGVDFPTLDNMSPIV